MKDRTELGREAYELGLRLGALGPVAIGGGGGSLALALARCAGAGAALAGAEVKFHDGGCAAAGAWLGRYYGLPATLFVRQKGREVRLYVLDGQGRPFDPPEAGGGQPPCTGEWDMMAGVDCAWAAHRAAGARRPGAAVVEGPRALTLAMERMGCVVLPHARQGVPVFRGDEEGFALTVELDGAAFCPEGADALAAAAAFLAEPRAVPAFRPGEDLL